ncbi:MAG: glycogen debranching protein GlgX [Armatimonadetes bacterium]|nr:glycogen debranching protein GlgX [Armatimonadota bacterium]
MKNALPGRSYPPGAVWNRRGVNFSLYSRNATAVELELYAHAEDGRPQDVIRLEPGQHRTFHYWHAFVPNLEPGQLYGYRVEGPTGRGHRYDPEKLLLDPYGRATAVPASYDRKAASRPGDNAAVAMKSVVVDPFAYDWEDDAPPRREFSQTVIYELHVRGFTRDPSSQVASHRRGTYAGLIERIPYLVDLGVTAVELLPVFLFDAQDAPAGLTNYWGYSPVSFFSPHLAYSSVPKPLAAIDEFRDMVKALHRAGIEVILDVVYNHTAEVDGRGPTLCFRGIENSVYYLLNPQGTYVDVTGCGNTFNANHSVVRALISDSLRYWVEHMHVDGFRFDLASVLSRDEDGRATANPPVLWQIETDPVLAGTKLIAEAWDVGGLYQLGSFVGDRWREWNGRFRDDVRSFLKGDRGSVAHLAARLLASPDVFEHEEREPDQSINFVTCHDGFTLNDLVTYNRKHNELNREGNRDGQEDNRSWNCGLEGPTDDPEMERLRNRQVKNFLTVTLVSMGVPMLLMGDEIRRTQQGNNNAYCQDYELSWMDWRLLERHGDVYRFARELIHYRRLLEPFRSGELSLREVLRRAKVEWSGTLLGRPDWSDDSHSLTVTVKLNRQAFHLILNAYWEPLEFELPEGAWQRILDTFLEPPEDITTRNAPAVPGRAYRAGPRSIVLLAGPV